MILRPNLLNGRRVGSVPTARAARVTERRQAIVSALLCLVFALALWAVLAIRPPAYPGLQPGKPSPVSIQARRSMTYESEWRTQQERARAESAESTVVYSRDINMLTVQRSNLSNLLETIGQIHKDPTLRAAEERAKLAALPTSAIVISQELASDIAGLTDDQWDEVRRVSLDLYDRSMSEYNYGLNEAAIAELQSSSLPYWASLNSSDEIVRRIALLLVGAHLQTNLVIDEQATQARKQAARDAVKPVTVQIVEGESIVRAGDMVTPDVREKLEALGELNTETDWYDVAGKGILAALIGLLFGVYVRQTQRDVWLRTRPLATIVGLAVLTVLLARLLASVSVDLLYGFPLAITALLVATLFSGNLALFVTVLLVVPISIVGQESIGIAVTLIMGAVAAIFAIGRGERSLNFVLAGLTVSVVSTAAALAFALTNFRATSLDQLLVTGAYSGINGALTAVLALGMYNLLGHIAGIVTPMQLMELAHPAQPLLRKLIREAPGTYYHSIAVGNLAESAAEAIGADALLLRVASYYHDIGKTVRPFFFTDNQSDRENVHNDIDPHTSAGIIADHVREGAVLARQAGLPRQVIDFIVTHHGTSVIRHFYQLALQQNDTVDIDDYRYPGPRPRTREQAIMMLSDSVEATVRSKYQHGKVRTSHDEQSKGSDAQTIEELVDTIIDERMRSGQLDDSQLTLHDIARIKQAFITTLRGIYHPRTEYAQPIVKMS